MKIKLVRFLVVLASLVVIGALLAPVRAEPLSPPIVSDLSECSTHVWIKGQLTGAKVTVVADGHLVASGTATGPEMALEITTPLVPGQEVRARQELGSSHSPLSPDPVIVGALGAEVPKVAFRSVLNTCGRCLSIENLVPGADVFVYSNDEMVGQAHGTRRSATVALNKPLDPSDSIVAWQVACGRQSETITGPPLEPLATPMTPLVLEGPLQACQQRLRFSNVLHGADVLSARDTKTTSGCGPWNDVFQRISPALEEGETVRAVQHFPGCKTTSSWTEPQVVGPLEVDAPSVVDPLCAGSFRIDLTDVQFGAKLMIYNDDVPVGMAEAYADGTVSVDLASPLSTGDRISARQELCGEWSEMSWAVTVGPSEAGGQRPAIQPPVDACGPLVEITNVTSGSVVTLYSKDTGPISDPVLANATSIKIPATLVAEDRIFAEEVGCRRNDSTIVLVKPPPALHTPKIPWPLYDMLTEVRVHNVQPGARVHVYVDQVWSGSTVATNKTVDVPLTAPLRIDDRVQAKQTYCGQVSDTSPGQTAQFPHLPEWLERHPKVSRAIIYDSLDDKEGWASWPDHRRMRFLDLFQDAWYELPMELPDPPENVLVLQDAQRRRTALSFWGDSFELFAAHVAQSLALELGGRVAWSLEDLDPTSLALILDSRTMFDFDPDPNEFPALVADWVNAGKEIPAEHWLNDSHDGMGVLPAPPDVAYRFLRNNDLIGPTQRDTVYRLMDWAGKNIAHQVGPPGMIQGTTSFVEATWSYRGHPPVTRMLEGTIASYNPQKIRWYEGCGGMNGFLRSLLRTVNVPVTQWFAEPLPELYNPPPGAVLASGVHSQPMFPSLGRVMCHADDVLYAKLEAIPPLSPADVLVDPETYHDWMQPLPTFTEFDAHVGRCRAEARKIVLPFGLLRRYCADEKDELSHEDGRVAASFATYFPVSELEAEHLWERLHDKVQFVSGDCQTFGDEHGTLEE